MSIETHYTAQTADGTITARAWRPEGEGPFPIVLCFHHGPGLGEEIYDVARNLADLGYLAAAPDVYYREGAAISFNLADLVTGGPDLERLFRIVAEHTPEIMVADAVAILEAIKEDPAASKGPAGAIGFCHTARTVVVALAEHPELFAAGVFMHPFQTVTEGADSPHLLVPKIQGRLYGAFGGGDEIAPVEQQQPLIDGIVGLGERGGYSIFPDANHGFLFQGTEASAYHDEAATGSWAKTVEFFDRGLKQSITA